MKIFVPVVVGFEIFLLRVGVGVERPNPAFHDPVTLLGSLDTLDCFRNLVSREQIFVFCMLNRNLVSNLEQHLMDKSVRGYRNVSLDVGNQLLCVLVGLDRQDKFATDYDLQHHHTHAPEVPV